MRPISEIFSWEKISQAGRKTIYQNFGARMMANRFSPGRKSPELGENGLLGYLAITGLILVHSCTLLTVLHTFVQRFTELYTSVQCCTLLYTVVHCCTALYTVVWCCSLLYSVIHCCTLLYTVVYCCTVLFSVVQCYTLL